MTDQAKLKLLSTGAALLWTLLMIWWTGVETVNIVMLSIAGVVFGVLWYFGMRWWSIRQGLPK